MVLQFEKKKIISNFHGLATMSWFVRGKGKNFWNYPIARGNFHNITFLVEYDGFC